MSEIEKDCFVTVTKNSVSSAAAGKYDRVITDRHGNSVVVDVYDVLKAFNVTNPADQHALKKILCMGLRGHKDTSQDRKEAIQSLQRGGQL